MSFEALLLSSSLPDPGPEYYEARRRIWLTPRVNLNHSRPRIKFDEFIHSKSRAFEKIWKGLCSGSRLKRGLPLATIIKITQAAWVRDQTWPAGMEAPSSDEEQDNS